MAVTSKNLRSVQRTRAHTTSFARRLQALAYGVTLLLAALAVYAVVSLLLGKVDIAIDDLRYGRPRTIHMDAFVGHGEDAGHPTHLMAMNLNRQVVVVELPGGDAANARTISGPYLFGANEDLTPVLLSLRDMDGDGQLDLLLDVRREQIVYLNKDGAFRPPTLEEQALLNYESSP
jgi:hypothetical protein